VAEDWTEVTIENTRRGIIRVLTRTAVECTNDLKKIVSVAAPRKVSKKTGRVYARTKATPGAPPRKLTGRGRASISYRIDKPELVARVGTNVLYMRVHEQSPPGTPGLHQWVVPTMALNHSKYERLLAGG